ncbi:MAG TPA: winged helix-turn-helix domain-containing protein [Pyrinomonadaceae bacterium]|nr:winged helix-turn-helix domain-containing protein [Pyrinomonadaceae bacterium]
MGRLVKDLLVQSARETFVGRTAELEVLSTLLDTGPRVILLHGIAGVGKSALLGVFTERARTKGTAVITLDCRAMEPTERGFLQELKIAIGGPITRVEQAARRLRTLGDRVLLVLDNYEVFRLMDTWLRQVFMPLLPDNVRVVLAGRDAPVHSWFTTAGWQGLVRTIPLDALSETDAITLLVHAGASETEARLINRFALGHPLALKLASIISVANQDTKHLPDFGFQRVFDELMRIYLAEVQDPITRRALDAASVVRRITVSLLQAMLPDVAPQDAFERLKVLPFANNEHDGLRLHELIQQAIATSLQSTDPNKYQEYRRAAWRQLSIEARQTSSHGLWRYTSDLLYMIANPVVREAFFPSGVRRYVVEPSRADDGPAICEITRMYESRRGAELMKMWWTNVPHAFYVARDEQGQVAGFYLMFDPSEVEPSLLGNDPLVKYWSSHLAEDPVPNGQRVLFLRRWLSRDKGEHPGSVQATCWLDIKRTYMEMRPSLRRVYVTLNDPGPYGPVAQTLGFRPLSGKTLLSEKPYYSVMLDMGPGSVDGWLASLGAAELNIEQELLDPQAHELVLNGNRVKLTKLEFEVFQYLYNRKGIAVSRASLVEDVWGWKHTGSNVIEAVMRTLRKKLGNRSTSIETIRGLGYRFRNT